MGDDVLLAGVDRGIAHVLLYTLREDVFIFRLSCPYTYPETVLANVRFLSMKRHRKKTRFLT
jgi:hypothetical protein